MPDQHVSMHQKVTRLRAQLLVDVCTLYRASAEARVLEIAATSGLNASAVGSRLSFDQGLTGKVARTERPVAARDIQSHPEYYHVDGSGEEVFTSYLGIPLIHLGDLYGILVVQTRETKTFFHKEISELYSVGRELLDALLTLRAEVS